MAAQKRRLDDTRRQRDECETMLEQTSGAGVSAGARICRARAARPAGLVSKRRRTRHGSVFHELIPLCVTAVASTTHMATSRSCRRRKRDIGAAFSFFAED
jgi:hypothetical protein